MENLPPDLRVPPSDLGRALTALVSPENLFRVLEILLAGLLLTRLRWWRESGFNEPPRWRNSHLLWVPLLVGALPLFGGVSIPGPAFFASVLLAAFLAAFADEALYRGVMWRALVPTGLVRAVLLTALLSGALHFAGLVVLSRPWPEAFLLATLTTCGGFTYAALRWRTASIWPVILLHFASAFVSSVSTPGAVPYLVPLLFFAGTLGLVVYGLFLIRNPRVRADGG